MDDTIPQPVYCTACGKMMRGEAIICPNCGVATPQFAARINTPSTPDGEPMTDGSFTLAVVTAIALPVVGLIWGCIAMGRPAQKEQGKRLLWWALGAWVFWILVMAAIGDFVK